MTLFSTVEHMKKVQQEEVIESDESEDELYDTSVTNENSLIAADSDSSFYTQVRRMFFRYDSDFPITFSTLSYGKPSSS